MITWIIIWLTLMALVLVVLIQRKWTNWGSWFLVIFALMVIAVVVGGAFVVGFVMGAVGMKLYELEYGP